MKPEVRERVQLVAKAVGYRPNRAARNLAGGRANIIGLVIEQSEMVKDPYGVSLIQWVAQAADAHDEGLMLIADSREPTDAVAKILADGLVDGVIISAVVAGVRWVEELMGADIPCVLIGAHPRRTDVPVVDVENHDSARSIVGHLIDSGCRRVGTISGPLDRVDAVARLEGYRSAHQDRSMTVDEELIIEGDFARPTGYREAAKLIDAGVDAIFCANDEMALGAIHRAREADLLLPEDLSIAGFDGMAFPIVDLARVTSAVQPFEELAEAAVRTLIGLIEGASEADDHIITPKIVFGDTTWPPS